MRVLALISLLVVSFLSVRNTPVSGQGLVDQQCPNVGGGYLDAIGNNFPTGQLFSPTQTSVIGFTINIFSTNDRMSIPMTARILEGGITGSVIASANLTVTIKFGLPSGTWLRVDFFTGIQVVPGNIYALDLIDNLQTNDIKWNKCADDYAAGSGYAKGVLFSDHSDFTFIIYSGDYTLNISPTRISVAQGSSGTTTLIITPENRFASSVDLSVIGSIPGVTTSFAPNPVTPTADQSATSILTFEVGSNVATGSYDLTVLSESGALSQSVKVTVTVSQSGPVPDFSIDIVTSSISLVHGTSATFTTVVTPTSGFSSAVYLSGSGLPAGFNLTFAPNPVLPSEGHTVTSVGTVTLARSTAPGKYTITVTGISVILSHSTTVTVDVQPSANPDFSINASPTTVSVAQGSSGTATITIISLNSFISAVDLSGSWVGSAPAAVTFTLPSPITPPDGGEATSTLTFSSGSAASAGTYSFRVTATSRELTHAVDLNIRITTAQEDFTISLSPTSLTLSTGSSAVSTITVQSVGAFSSAIDLASSGAPNGVSVIFSSNTMTPPAGGTTSSVATVTVTSTAVAGTYPIVITGSSGTLSHTATLTVQITTGARCLIATATYGSELSPEVQFLRSFRDNSILKTRAGSNFMVAFNTWYYSFSPQVALFIAQHQVVRTGMKIALYPLIGILQLGATVFYLLPAYPELAAVVSGLITSSLIGAFLLAFPLAATLSCTTRGRKAAKKLERPMAYVLCCALTVIFVQEILNDPSPVLILTTSTAVLATLIGSTLFTSRTILRLAKF